MPGGANILFAVGDVFTEGIRKLITNGKVQNFVTCFEFSSS